MRRWALGVLGFAFTACVAAACSSGEGSSGQGVGADGGGGGGHDASHGADGTGGSSSSSSSGGADGSGASSSSGADGSGSSSGTDASGSSSGADASGSSGADGGGSSGGHDASGSSSGTDASGSSSGADASGSSSGVDASGSSSGTDASGSSSGVDASGSSSGADASGSSSGADASGSSSGVDASGSSSGADASGSSSGADAGGDGGDAAQAPETGAPPCSPGCTTGQSCNVAGDCASRVCTGGTCQAPTCSDGVENGLETGTDCGGPFCPACPPGQGCGQPSDCTSFVCKVGVCQAPTCSDGIQNGKETDVDCGGPACNPCSNGAHCSVDADCVSTHCTSGICGNFSIGSIPGLLLWLDANKGITLSSGFVTAWADQSGAGDPGRNAQQPTPSNLPGYNAADPSYNGQATLSMLSNQWMVTGAWSTAPAQPLTVVVVGEQQAGGTHQQFLTDSISAASEMALYVPGGGGSIDLYAGAVTGASGQPTNSPGIFLAEYNGASSAVYHNNPTTPLATGNAGTNGITGLTIGAGAGAPITTTSLGKFATVLVVQGLLSPGTKAQLFQSLQSRYGL